MRTTSGVAGRGRAVAAAVLCTAVGASVFGLAPARASSEAVAGWNPDEVALGWLPDPSVDGELSVTRVDASNKGELQIFLRDGTPAGPQFPVYGRQHQWSPGGDAITGGMDGPEQIGRGDDVEARATDGPASWSAFGDSILGMTKVATRFMPSAQWTVDTSRGGGLMAPQAYDPGVPAATPDGYGIVVTVPATGLSGKRDLGLAAKERGTEAPVFPRLEPNGVQTRLDPPTALGYGELDARQPTVGADGTLAFVGTSPTGPAVFVDEGAGPVQVAALGGDCPGQTPTFSPSATALAFVSSDAGCTSSTLRILPRTNGTFAGAIPTTVSASPAGSTFESVSWRARTPSAVAERLAGSDRIGTGIAVSQWGWPKGSLDAVLTSSTAFPDAVVAGPLAGGLGAPLLLTGSTSLDARVLAELERLTDGIEPARRTVHIVGGTGVVSSAVQTSLTNRGFRVVRHAGTDRYATSVEVAKVIRDRWSGDQKYLAAFLADGRTFPDALSAGPAAVHRSAPVLLTDGERIPTVVRSHITTGGYTTVFGVGGAASRAASAAYGSKAYALAGKDRYVTNYAVARHFFPGGAVLGYASGQSFPDALTGGALMGALGQPIVLVHRDGMDQHKAIGRAYRSGTDAVLVFGGTGAVSTKVLDDARRNAGNQTALWGPTTPSVDRGTGGPFRSRGIAGMVGRSPSGFGPGVS